MFIEDFRSDPMFFVVFMSSSCVSVKNIRSRGVTDRNETSELCQNYTIVTSHLLLN